MKSKNLFSKSKTIFFVIIFITTLDSFAQTPGEWTWMHGDNTPNALGLFGTQGVPNPANKPPAVYEPCEWKDSNGNFWLFGGGDNSFRIYDALWKFDPATNQWTWMKGSFAVNQVGVYGTQGVPSPANFPPAKGYGATTWVDASGNLWLFGGCGYDAFGVFSKFNDLWKYVIATNEWTWIKGPNTVNDPGSYGTMGVPNPANLPPSRSEASCSWTDNAGNLWLYGGQDQTGNTCGDLWRYNIAANEWTWMHGASTLNAPPVYGTQGLAAPANTPGGREVFGSWTDLAGNLWLFGGLITNAVTNDLWKYDIAANQWIWMKGANTPGSYGTKCITTNNNMPPARMENRARVRDTCGNFWHFAGGARNDLWHYNVSANQWTWVSGDNIPSQAAVYGTQGISSSTNKPGARYGNVAWMDNNGYIWIFGGMGQGINYHNDLFRYVPDPACPALSSAITVSSNTTICNGQSATLTASGGTSYLWSPSGQSTSSVVVSPLISTLYTVTGKNGCSSGSSSVTVTVSPAPSITVSLNTVICIGQSATLTVSGGTSYLWSPGGQSTSGVVVSPTATTIYTVIVSDANNCSATATATVTANNMPTATISSTNILCSGENDGTAAVAAAGGTPLYTYLWSPVGGTGSFATGLSAGVYTVTVIDANGCASVQVVTINPGVNLGKLYLPNVFSPNNNGENDMLCLQGNSYCIQELTIIIYDRWGEKVYESNDKNFCWDGICKGRIMNSSVFVYYLDVTLINGERIIKKGNVSLIQ